MTFTSNQKNVILKRKKLTILASSSATEKYKWTQRNLKASQIGQYPKTPLKSANSSDSQVTTATSFKVILKSHALYLTSPKRQSFGTGENHNIKPSKNSKHACVHVQSSHNQISTNHSSFKQMHQLMVWAPYSRRRVNTMQSPPKNPNYTQLHTTLQLSHPPNETMTSTNENSLQ